MDRLHGGFWTLLAAPGLYQGSCADCRYGPYTLQDTAQCAVARRRDRPRVRVVYQQTGAAAPRSRGMRYAYLALLGPPYTSPLQTMLQNDERLRTVRSMKV